jgi:CBS domain-containing protein
MKLQLTRPPIFLGTTTLQATVQDLDLPPALSFSPSDSISTALLAAYERDYTHLTIVSASTRALLGYLSIPRLKTLLARGLVQQEDQVGKAMWRFQRRGTVYRVITPDTELWELERFFEEQRVEAESGAAAAIKKAKETETATETETETATTVGKDGKVAAETENGGFAVVTDAGRRFVVGVVTRGDLEEFVKRRPL